MPSTTKAYLIGSGIGSLAAAAFMIRDGGVAGRNILIFERESALGGSLDAAGNSSTGYSMRGGRMLTSDNYECTWDLFKSVPSLQHPEKSVYQETMEFNREFKSDSRARLVTRQRAIVPGNSMGFSMHDREELLALYRNDEGALGRSRITDWLSPEFFETNFWTMWSTTFAFQPWHSAVEFRRYLHRFILEFPRIETLAGVKRTIFNQFDSLVRPLEAWLVAHGVKICLNCCVTDVDHRYTDGMFVVTGLQYRDLASTKTIAVDPDDLVFVQNGSMTDASSVGSMTAAPAHNERGDGGAWSLWEKLAQGRPGFGEPRVFNSCIAESWWGSFTITLHEPGFFNAVRDFSGNVAGTGGLVTFKESNWQLSMVLAHQPHFLNQPAGTQVLWGYALSGDRIGNFVAKPMAECNGAEILKELCGHLRFDLSLVKAAICLPCRMPYITSQFMPRLVSDRPLPVPRDSKNLAFVGQFVEIPEDTVFTVEYSVRAAQMAVYQFLAVKRAVPPVSAHDRSMRAEFQAVIKAFH